MGWGGVGPGGGGGGVVDGGPSPSPYWAGLVSGRQGWAQIGMGIWLLPSQGLKRTEEQKGRVWSVYDIYG